MKRTGGILAGLMVSFVAAAIAADGRAPSRPHAGEASAPRAGTATTAGIARAAVRAASAPRRPLRSLDDPTDPKPAPPSRCLGKSPRARGHDAEVTQCPRSRPRAAAPRRPRRAFRAPSLTATADEFYGQVPVGPIARRDLSDRAKVVLAALCGLGRSSTTWLRASLEEIALAAGHSAKKVRRGLAELTTRGVIEWDSIGQRFRILFRLRGQHETGPSAPAPAIAAGPAGETVPETHKREPEWEPKREPVWEPKRAERPSPHTPVLFEREKEIESPACEGTTTIVSTHSAGSGEDDVHEPNYNPRAPLDEPDDQPTEDELLDAIAQRVIDLFGAANREWIRADVREFGEVAMEHALDKCERLPSPPRGYAYVRAILRNARDEGAEIGRPKTRSERFPAGHGQQNYNPGKPAPPEPPTAAELAEMIANAHGADYWLAKMQHAALRGMVASGLISAADVPLDVLDPLKPEKKPASGCLGKVPPTPAAEMYGPSVSAESYPPVRGGTRPKTELPAPQDAGREASPPDRAKPASNPTFQPFSEPSPPSSPSQADRPSARSMPASITSESCSRNPPSAARLGPPRADPPGGVGWPPPERRRC